MKPRDEAIRGLVEQWVARAEEDLGVAEDLLQRDSFFFASICFHAQQAAEKYLKAYLTHRSVEFPKTHALGELLDRVATKNVGLAEALRASTALTPYGATMRYPGDVPSLTREHADEAVRLARLVKKLVAETL
jgi:HEPN domain-containing protein